MFMPVPCQPCVPGRVSQVLVGRLWSTHLTHWVVAGWYHGTVAPVLSGDHLHRQEENICSGFHTFYNVQLRCHGWVVQITPININHFFLH